MPHGCVETEPRETADAALGMPQDDVPQLQHEILLQMFGHTHEQLHMRLHHQPPRLCEPENRQATFPPLSTGKRQGRWTAPSSGPECWPLLVLLVRWALCNLKIILR